MTLIGLLAGGTVTAPPDPPGPLTDLPDLIVGGERLAPYTLPMVPSGYTPYRPGVPAIIPTYDGSGYAVHPSVVDMVHETGAPFRGFRYWMGITPYAGSNDQLENPCVVVSNHGWEWQEPQGISNPLDTPTSGWYFSDTDLVWDHDADRFILYYRNIGSGTYALTSSDGITWMKHGVISTDNGISPSIVHKGPGDWWMWLDGYTGTRLRKAPDPLGPWTLAAGGITVPDPGTYGDLWHYDVIWDEATQHFFMIGCDRGWETFPAVSADGITWVGGPRITGNTYRPTMTPADDPDWFNVWGTLDGNPNWTIQYTQYPRSLWTNLIA